MTGAYIYQTIHTLDGRPFRLARHRAILDHASRTLFDRPFPLDDDTLARQVAALAETDHTDRSIFMRIVLTDSGDICIEPAGTSLYRGFDLRSLSPEAVTVCCDLPTGDYPTSVREAAAAFAAAQAARQGIRSVVRCNSAGIALTGDEAPLFAVRGMRLFTSPTQVSVEAETAAEAIAAAGLKLTTEPLMCDKLKTFDELFYFDHRGVTALSRCNGHPYMPIIAERVARAAARLMPESRKM